MIVFKVIILGDAGCGKTCLMNNYLGNPFNEADPPTIGVEFGSKVVNLDKFLEKENLAKYIEVCEGHKAAIDKTIKTTLWGTSGQERFHSIVMSYYRNVQGVIFVCDLTRKITFNHLKYWIEDFKNNSNTDLKKVGAAIVANKTDLDEIQEVYESEIAELAAEYDMPYFLVSSKNDKKKVQNVFLKLSDLMFEKFLEDPDDHFIEINAIKLEKKRSKLDQYYKSCCLLL